MTTTVLTTQEDATRVLIEQTKTCISASWAVAWATPNKVFDAALARMDVFKRLIVGTHGSQTHPNCLRALAKHPGKAFIRRNSAELFHPKLYIFEHAAKFSVVIGSHNLTRGAFEVNEEVSLLIDFDKADPSVEKLLDWMKKASQDMLCVVYSPAWMTEYERLYELAKQKRKEIDELRRDTSSQAETDRREKLPINLTWDEWYEQVSSESSPSHDIKRRLEMLDYIGDLFGRYPSYAAMPLEDRMRVSGMASKEMTDRDEIDWGYFGSMKTAVLRPNFKTLVLENPTDLSAALDIIPLTGPVNADHWNRYWAEVRRVDADRGSLGRGLASRLATVRRPDVFVSLNTASSDQLAKLLGVAAGSLDGPTYWTRVIQVVQQTRWFVADEPSDAQQARAWRARAALLDSLVYKN
jgi:hypothetical protein